MKKPYVKPVFRELPTKPAISFDVSLKQGARTGKPMLDNLETGSDAHHEWSLPTRVSLV